MKKIFVIIISLIVFQTVSAQVANSALFNTASNAGGTGTLGINASDLNWMVSMTSTAGPFVAAVSCGNPYPSNWAISSFSNANWISYPHNCAPVLGWLASPSEHSCLNPADLDVYYRLLVNLPATICNKSVSSPNTYCLAFDFFADNTVYEVLVNGVSAYFNTTSNPYLDMDYKTSNGKSVSLCNNWIAGNNTVIVHIKSGQGSAPTWEGLLAQVNPTLSTTVAPSVTVAISTTPVKCSGSNLTFTASGAVSYTWLPVNQTGSTITVTPNVTTTYTVSGVNAMGCQDIKTFTQVVEKCTGIAEQKDLVNAYQILPNPSSGVFLIKGISKGDAVEVLELTGRSLYSSIGDGEDLRIDLSEETSGLYLIKVAHTNFVIVKKLIKE